MNQILFWIFKMSPQSSLLSETKLLILIWCQVTSWNWCQNNNIIIYQPATGRDVVRQQHASWNSKIAGGNHGNQLFMQSSIRHVDKQSVWNSAPYILKKWKRFILKCLKWSGGFSNRIWLGLKERFPSLPASLRRRRLPPSQQERRWISPRLPYRCPPTD